MQKVDLPILGFLLSAIPDKSNFLSVVKRAAADVSWPIVVVGAVPVHRKTLRCQTK
jgi:hypothetical protein